MPDRRFDRVAPLYARVRPGYPDELYDLLVAAHGGRPFETAVDLGCGTGQSVEGLFRIAREVVGVEPADAMRREAEARFPSARFVRAGAQETGLPDRCCELVTIATAFHWMQAESVLAECARILRPGGVLGIYWYDVPRVEGPAQAVLDEHMRARWDAHRSARLLRLHEIAPSVARAPGFEGLRELPLPRCEPWPVERFVDFERSTSYVSAYMAQLGPAEAERYVESFTRELRAKAGDELTVLFDLTLCLARRSGE